MTPILVMPPPGQVTWEWWGISVTLRKAKRTTARWSIKESLGPDTSPCGKWESPAVMEMSRPVFLNRLPAFAFSVGWRWERTNVSVLIHYLLQTGLNGVQLEDSIPLSAYGLLWQATWAFGPKDWHATGARRFFGTHCHWLRGVEFTGEPCWELLELWLRWLWERVPKTTLCHLYVYSGTFKGDRTI